MSTRCRRSLTSSLLTSAVIAIATVCPAVEPIPGSSELTRCNGFDPPEVAWAAVASGAAEPIPLQSLDPPVFLPDGREFKTWEQPAEHRQTFFVAQAHPDASDDNPGTEDRPWKTIGRAAKVLEPGDRVIVRQGHYREWVCPARGGSGPKQMITYQAAPGEMVIISGSEPLTGNWLASVLADQPPMAKAWMIDLPEALFGDYNPFAEANATTNLISDPAVARQGRDKPPYTLARGLVFQNGKRLKQVACREALAESAGAYWVEPGGKRLHLRPIADAQPNQAQFEITTRPFAFAPRQAGLGFLCVDGFTIEHVANCYPIPQLGAISTRQGHHWIVQNNLVRQVNGLGLDYGRLQSFLPRPVPADTPKLAGVGVIVRNNAFYQCGICSMQGLGLIGGWIEGNYVQDCCWHDVEKLWEAAAIKLHWDKHILVRRNVVDGTIGAPGIWVDHSNTNVRVTQNIVVRVRSAAYGGIFFEASYKPNLIDRNIVWDCTPHGFYQHNCGDLTVVNNLIGCCAKAPVRIAPQGSEREVDLETRRPSVVVRNHVLGNVFYGFGDRGPLVPGGNVSDYNLFVNPPGEEPIDLAAWRKDKGQEFNSGAFLSKMEFSLADGTWTLRQSPLLPEFACPRIFEVQRDFLGAPLPPIRTTQAGPFLPQNLKAVMTGDCPKLPD